MPRRPVGVDTVRPLLPARARIAADGIDVDPEASVACRPTRCPQIDRRVDAPCLDDVEQAAVQPPPCARVSVPGAVGDRPADLLLADERELDPEVLVGDERRDVDELIEEVEGEGEAPLRVPEAALPRNRVRGRASYPTNRPSLAGHRGHKPRIPGRQP